MDLIKSIYSEDESSRDMLFQAIGQKIIESQEIFLIGKPLDILSLICMTASFASSKEECQQVAIILSKRLKDENPLPYISDDQGLLLAEKTLVSLAFYSKAMERRWKYKGAPKPSFYRDCSKLIFKKNNLDYIADNHENWENFLSELFI
jgi:hypothetical protein